MNEPKPEYGYHFVSQDDLQPGDEHWNTNAWELCATEQGRHHCTRRRLILPPEGMRILGVDETIEAKSDFRWFRNNVWESCVWGKDTTVKEAVEYVNGNTRGEPILAIAAPIVEKVEPKATTPDAKCAFIYTPCPACHNSTLVINKGRLLCNYIDCPDPTLIDHIEVKKTCKTWVNCPVCGECDMEKTIECTNHACASNGGDNFDGIESSRTCKPIWNRVSKDCLPDENKPFWSVEKDVVYHYSTGRTRIALHHMADGQPNWTHWMPCNPPFGRPPLPEKDKPEWESWLDTWMNDRHPFPSPGYQVEYNVSMEAVKAALLAAKRKPSILESVKEEKE